MFSSKWKSPQVAALVGIRYRTGPPWLEFARRDLQSRGAISLSQSGANVTWQLVEDGRGRCDLPQGGGPAAAASKA